MARHETTTSLGAPAPSTRDMAKEVDIENGQRGCGPLACGYQSTWTRDEHDSLCGATVEYGPDGWPHTR